MCYSGICRWENHSGDCIFPTNKYVRAKYKYPLCELPTCKEEDEYFKSDGYKLVIDDIYDIIKRSKLYDERINKIKKIRQHF